MRLAASTKARGNRHGDRSIGSCVILQLDLSACIPARNPAQPAFTKLGGSRRLSSGVCLADWRLKAESLSLKASGGLEFEGCSS